MSIKNIKFILPLFLILILLVYSLYKSSPYIIISGDVIYNEFDKGDIEIYWTSVLNMGGPPDPRFERGLTFLPRPGPYRLKIPKNYGQIYICSRNRGTIHQSYAYFISEPVIVGKKDIKRYNIVLKKNKLLMDSYKGKTVKLSGNIYCSRCEKGTINVCVYSPDWFKKIRLPPDIAKANLTAPGKFILEVPENYGNIFLEAVNIPEGEKSGNSPRSLHANYSGNPLEIKDSNIDGIKIKIN